MTIYWIKAQAPLRVLALINHLGIEAPDRRQEGPLILVEAGIEQRKRDSYPSRIRRAPAPDGYMRRTRPTAKSARAEQ